MKTWRYGVAVGMLAGLGACSNMMGGNNNAPRSQAAAQPTMTQPTVAPEMVKKVQSKLRDDGYYKQGPVDGRYGPETESAVRSFQRDHNLGSSGQLDVATLQALNVTNSSQTGNNNTPTQPATNNPNTQPADNNPNTQPADNNLNTPQTTNNPNPTNNPNTTTNPNTQPADNNATAPAH